MWRLLSPPPPPTGDSPITRYLLRWMARDHREEIEGKAKQRRHLLQRRGIYFDVPGAYVGIKKCVYTDKDHRLWAASIRSAGVNCVTNGELIAHGQERRS